MDYSERDYIRAADAKGRGLTRMSVLFCCSIKSAGIWEIQERSGTGDLSGMVQRGKEQNHGYKQDEEKMEGTGSIQCNDAAFFSLVLCCLSITFQ